MSEVEFYRDHIAGLRSQLVLRDRKIEQLEKAVTRGVRLLSAIIDDLAKITNGSEKP